MIVSRLGLRNWRNFRDAEVALGSRVFLAGPNASGKSNFLDLFRFLRDIAKPGGGLQKAISDRGGLSKIRCLAARQHPNVEIRAGLSDGPGDPGAAPKWRYELGIQQEPRGRRLPQVAYERVYRCDQELLVRPIAEDRRDPLRLTQTHLEQINANQDFRPIADFFRAAAYLHLVPQLVQKPDAFKGQGLPEDPYGRDFIERVVRTPEKTQRARLRKIEAALKIAVPQFEQLQAIKDELGIGHLQATYVHWRPDGARQWEDQFSDGTLRLIALIWSVLDGDGLLLLEEPELSLNAAIVRRLPALIYRLQRQRQRQVIVSTHSTDLLSDKGIGGEEVLLLEPSKEGTTIRPSSSLEVVKHLLDAGMSVGEAVLPRTEPTGVDQLDLFE